MFYKKGIDITNAKSMFNFINEHYTYWTLNSWNGLSSIANNVKLYNLKLDGDWGTACNYIFDECDIGGIQWQFHDMISDWEADHPGYRICWNGRSDGYLVLMSEQNNCNIIPEVLRGYDSYEDWKQSVKESWYGETVKDYIPMLREYTELIRSFDRLCDELRDITNAYSQMDYEAEVKAMEAE